MLYDVVIVGAGPAGGSAAVHCAKAGLKTLLLEEHKTVGEPVHCGECLSDYALENTGFVIPEKVVSKRVKGVKVIFPDYYSPVFHETGMVLEKHLFEQYLVHLAENNSVDVKLNAKVNSISRLNNAFVITHSRGEDKARLIMDASGVQSVCSRFFGLKQSFDTVVGLQCELTDIEHGEFLDFYLWPELAPHGYLWVIPKSNNRANVGLVTNDKNNAKKYLDAFLKIKGWEEKKPVKVFGGLIPSSGPLPKTFDDGLLLIGDAAGFTSPMFEGGTHLSLKSSEMATRVAVDALNAGNTSKEFLRGYEVLWKQAFPEYRKILSGKNALYGFSSKELSFIGRALPKNLSEINISKKIMIGAKLLKNPSVFNKGVINALMTFSQSQARSFGW
ncbi:MAG: NAD(P)/FAD-dependent oxidoreductase [Candidatus Micrarchaeota archaeon]